MGSDLRQVVFSAPRKGWFLATTLASTIKVPVRVFQRAPDSAVPKNLGVDHGHAVGRLYERTILGTSVRDISADAVIGAKQGYGNLDEARLAAVDLTRGPVLPAAIIYGHNGRYFARTARSEQGPLHLSSHSASRRDAGYALRFIHPAAHSILDGTVELRRQDDPALRHPSAHRIQVL